MGYPLQHHGVVLARDQQDAAPVALPDAHTILALQAGRPTMRRERVGGKALQLCH